MLRRYRKEEGRWDGVEPHVYKADPTVFRDVTKQVLFEREGDLSVQFRCFSVAPGGYTSLERHEHMHVVVIFEGTGHALLGTEVQAVAPGDFLSIPPWTWHQFRADAGEPLRFFCLVNADRDRPTYPTEADMAELRSHPDVAAFLGR